MTYYILPTQLWDQEIRETMEFVAQNTEWQKFARWMLTDPDHGVFRFVTSEEARKIIQHVAKLCEKHTRPWRISPTENQWREAAKVVNKLALDLASHSQHSVDYANTSALWVATQVCIYQLYDEFESPIQLPQSSPFGLWHMAYALECAVGSYIQANLLIAYAKRAVEFVKAEGIVHTIDQPYADGRYDSFMVRGSFYSVSSKVAERKVQELEDKGHVYTLVKEKISSLLQRG